MRNSFISVLLLCLAVFTACGTVTDKNFDINSINSYKEIPEVTEEEIIAIEALKSERSSFYYGQMLETESFILPDGTYAGFTTELCGLLTSIFDIPFVQGIYEWDALKSGFDNMLIDFTGDMTPVPERMLSYYMTTPIAERSQRIFTLASAEEIKFEKDINGLKVGFFKDSIDLKMIIEGYPDLDFEVVNVDDFASAAEMLRTGQIDVFASENVIDPFFNEYDFIRSKEFFNLVYTPVSLSTANPDLEPIISVVNKYLAAGGIDKLLEMYKQGEQEYAKYKLHKSFSDEERAYLADLSLRGDKVRLALEWDNYPVSFYNEKSRMFEGIATEVLADISSLTGIEFENVATKYTPWTEVLEGIRSGEISIVSELLYTESRKNDYLWSSVPYVSTNCALLSKVEYPNKEIYQVNRSTVGIVNQQGHSEIYKKLLPNNNNTISYSSIDEAFEALEKNEIDLYMASEHILLKQTNFREKSGYKVNFRFNIPADSLFGFNKNEDILRTIIDKAQAFVKTDIIASGWTNRVYDYSRTSAYERATYLSIFVAILFVTIIMGIFMYMHSKGLSKNLDKQSTTLSTIFNSTPDMVFCKDINFRYTSCNSSYEEFMEKKESEIIGKTDLEVFLDKKDMALGFIETDKKVIQENLTQVLEENFIYADGRNKLMETIKTPLIQNGVTVGLLGISRDITEHKRAVEEATAASQAKSMFLAHMSHEIRTPMNAIVGMAELNLREKMTPALYENTLSIKHAGANLLSIINDILDFSKIEAGKLEIMPEEYTFISLINDVLSIIRMKITEKPLLLAANVDCATPGRLIGDEARIRQILLNILSNAVKYTNEGFVSVSIASDVKEDEAILTIEVSDSGTGIKKEDLNKLFSDFMQLSNSKGIQGTGLGLAITKSLCQAMGGNITVSSEYGVGSTFTVTLPQKISTYEEFAGVENAEQKETLVYETRSVYANSIMESLENLGVRCTLASNQSEFSKELGKKRYPYVFISSFLYEDASQWINNLNFKSKLILITEFGEAAPVQGIGTLTMPAHSLSIANILNDVTNIAGYNALGKTNILFAAPTAKVLIVDDVGTNLKVAEGLMSPYRMQVDTCRSGAEAVRMVVRKHYDIIFMDHMMPVMDGLETTEKIRSIENENGYYKTVPIIALTANAVSGMRDMFIQNGLNDFLAKPIEIPKLNSILEKWIPKEKREKNVDRSSMESSFEIEGIDLKSGISLTGGVDNYLSALAAFHKEGWDKVNGISKCLEHDDIEQYTDYVHELRNAAARIGARRVSDLARTMEIAGKSNAFTFIHENTEDLLTELRALLQNIKIALMKAPNERHILEGYDINSLESRLKKLKASIENMDVKLMDTLSNELRNSKTYDKKISITIGDISTHMLMSEYDEAEELIDTLLAAFRD